MTHLAPPRRRSRLLLALAITALFGGAAVDGQVLSPNLLFTSIQPCRVFDTRVHGDPLVAGAPRGFTVVGDSGDFANQGGHPGGCGIPGFLGGNPQVQAVIINLVAVTPASQGELMAWPSDQPEPLASILNFTPAEVALANGVVIPVRQDHEGGDITILAGGSGTHALGDVLGYFSSGAPGMGNLSLGTGAGNQSASTGTLNTAIGDSALAANTTGTVNTALGYLALGLNTTGANNAAVGTFALNSNSTGNQNTALGRGALATNTAGGANTGLGYAALPFLSTGNNNVAIGNLAGISYTGGESNNVLISNAGVAGESEVIRIGTGTLGSGTQATYVAGIIGAPVAANGGPVYVDVFGKLGTAPISSLRFKEDVQDMGQQTAGLMKLRPVTFHYKPEYDDGSHLLQYGLVAEEVAQVYPDLVQYDQDGKPFTVRYHLINIMLLNEVQRQHRKLEEQHVQLAELAAKGAKVEELQVLVAAQRAQAEDGSRLAAAQQARIEELEARLAKVEAMQASQR